MNHHLEFSSGACKKIQRPAPIPDYGIKPVEWQKLLCFEVKRAYSISNGALVDCGGVFVVVVVMKIFFIYHIIGMKYMLV